MVSTTKAIASININPHQSTSLSDNHMKTMLCKHKYKPQNSTSSAEVKPGWFTFIAGIVVAGTGVLLYFLLLFLF